MTTPPTASVAIAGAVAVGASSENDSTIDALVVEVQGRLEARSSALARRLGTPLADSICLPGKMLRARFCLHLGTALGVDEAASMACACVAELTHNASLLHDDCVDEAPTRRGHPTPNALFGAKVGLLLGDLAFSQAVNEALEVSRDAARGLVDTVQEMTIGELQEEFVRGSESLGLDSYLGIAARKTGTLFEWCARAMSDLSPLGHSREDMPALGRNAGLLLQIVDDIHDFTLDGAHAGKERGRDLAGRRLTLPAVLALQDPDSAGRFLDLWRKIQPGPEGVSAIGGYLEKRGHFKSARAVALDILNGMVAAARKLPRPRGASELCAFLERMARREF